MRKLAVLVCAAFNLTAVSTSIADPAGNDLPSNAQSAAVYNPLALAGTVRLANRGYFNLPSKWLTPSIPVCWDSNDPNQANERASVRDAVTKSWQAHSALRFVGWGACAPDATGIRITVDDEGAYTADLGKNISGMNRGMVLNFTFANWSTACLASAPQRESCIRSIAVHEFGHAIGFAHEQNRPDAPGECAKLAQGSNGTVLLTPYDPSSVMNYCNPVYNNNGALSPGDIASVRQVYGG